MSGESLEDILVNYGHRVTMLVAEGQSLTLDERAVYEYYIFDSCVKNGGVSQYFCNCSLVRWVELEKLMNVRSRAFADFALHVNEIVSNAPDPYSAILGTGKYLDEFYDSKYSGILIEIDNILQANSF